MFRRVGDREILEWAEVGPATRALAEAIHADGWEPEVILAIARGGLIDTEALVAALEREQIAGAALDVTDPEPLPDAVVEADECQVNAGGKGSASRAGGPSATALQQAARPRDLR